MVLLIKPQFEAGKDKVGKKGVVRDKAVHIEVVEKIVEFANLCGFEILTLDYSPIKGPEGNIEYLIYLKKDSSADDRVKELDERAAEDLLNALLNGDEESLKRIIDEDMHKSIVELVDRAHGNIE